MSSTTTLSNSAYDKLKAFAQVVLPACGAAYFGLSEIWGLPAATKVVGSIVVIDTFLGILLSALAKNYVSSGAAFDGEIVVEDAMVEGESKKVFGLQFNAPPSPDELSQKDSITFKVVDQTSPLGKDLWGPQ